MKRARRLLNPATVLAGVALFVALGGTGWAGQMLGKSTVGTPQLKAKAVTTSKIADGAITKDKLAGGVLGGVTASKITKVDSPIAAVPANSTGTPVTAVCPAGAKAVAGGWSSGLYATPLSEGPTPDGLGWTVSFQGFGSPSSVSVSVICLAA